MAGIQASLGLYNNMSPVLTNVVSSMNLVISSAYKVQDATGAMFDTSALDSAVLDLQNAGVAIESMEADIAKANAQQQVFNETARESNQLFSGLKGQIIAMVGAFLGIKGFNMFTGVSDELTGAMARINQFNNDSAVSNEEYFQMVAGSADRSRTGIMETLDVVSKLGARTQGIFSDSTQVIQFSENLNKMFKIAGSSQAEIASASLQLTQALGSGVLRGEEFNAVFEAAPAVIQTIADYMGVPVSQMRTMAQEGQISADIVAAAMLGATDKINTEFENIPLKWEDVTARMGNTFLMSVMPAFTEFQTFINSEAFIGVTDSFMSGIGILAGALIEFVELSINGINMAMGVWENFKWPILIVLGLFALYKAELMLIAGLETAKATITSIHAGAQLVLAVATRRATEEQMKNNLALLGSPMFLIPALIITIVGLVYTATAAYNKATGENISATGLLVGAVATGVAFMWNSFLSLAEFFANVFIDPVGAVANLFTNLFIFITDGFRAVATIIDAIFKTDFSGMVQGMQDSVRAWGDSVKSENYVTFEKLDYGEVFGDWYDKGVGFESSVGSMFTPDTAYTSSDYNLPMEFDSLPGDISDVSGGVKDIKDKLDGEITFKNEDLTYLRELVTQRAIQNFSWDKLEVSVNNQFGDVHETADISNINSSIIEGLNEAVYMTAEGLGGEGY